MKQFIKSRTITYNLMSFTGFRSLMIFSLLLEAPRSYDEIAEYFRNHPYLKKDSISLDTLRVYINSLKMSGCVIEKTKRKEGSKYKLISHPFELQITDSQVAALKKVYRSIAKVMDIEELIAMDAFFRKLAVKTKNNNLLENYERVSVLNNIDNMLLQELLECCKRKLHITILYNSPHSGEKEINIISNRLAFTNNKLYIYGTCIEYSQYSYFQVSRIRKILTRKEASSKLSVPETTVRYEINLPHKEIRLLENEKIIESNDKKTVVEVTTSNLFPIKQKILYYAGDCKVLYPQSFKDDIIATLKKMNEVYTDEKE